MEILQGLAASVNLLPGVAQVVQTYPEFGWDGYHLQPAEAIAAALNRNDGSEGGVFLFVATQYRAEVEAKSKEKGFAIAPWDNGTPWRE